MRKNVMRRWPGKYIVACLLFSACLLYTGQAMAQKMRIHFEKVTLAKVVSALQQQSPGINFSYNQEAFEKIQVDQVQAEASSLNEILGILQKQIGLHALVDGNNITLKYVSVNKPALVRQHPGRVTGKIVDEENGEPVEGVTIRIGSTSLITDIDGSFSLPLPKGSYTATVSHVGYGTKEVSGIIVKDNETFPLQITVKREKGQLAGVVVKATARTEGINALYARQKRNIAITDGISAEQISRTPDNNAAQVLKRISGLQISQNKYVVVRGLSDRYNNVLLNGAVLPSSEPNRRDFAFDMVPSALIGRIEVNKTATPDVTGEFSGGLVQIHTKDVPEENFFQVNAGLGFNSQATGKDFIGLKRSKYAYLGFGDDLYKKPAGMSFGEYNGMLGAIENPGNVDDRKKAAAFLASIPSNWKMMRYTAQPVQNYQLSFGRNIAIKNNRFGILAALTYRNEQEADMNNQYEATLTDYKGTDYAFITTLGGSLNLAYTAGRHKFTWKNTYNRRFNDGLYVYSGRRLDGGSDDGIEARYSNVTIINQLFQSQLGGEHTFSKFNIKLDWSGGIADMDRDQPYNKIMHSGTASASATPDAYYDYGSFLDLQPQYGSLYYSALKEKMYNWAATIQVPFKLLKQGQSFKFGYQGRYRTADFGADFYKIRSLRGPGGVVNTSYSGWAYYDVYNAANFANSNFYLYPIAGTGRDARRNEGTGYGGFQRMHAWYGMLDLKPFEKLRIIGGVRVEDNNQNVLTSLWQLNNGRKDTLVTVIKTDWLPSVNVIYSLTPKFNIRAAYYETVARPDLRELSTFTYFDFNILRGISGSKLQTTNVKNADIRFEYYPSPGEIISVSGFHKRFFHPIELLVTSTSGLPSLEYTNLAGAEDIGLELDFRKSLNFLSPGAAFWQNLYLSGSFTYVDANITFTTDRAVDAQGRQVTAKRDRPLTGQSPYIINGGILYAGARFGVNAVYNRYGKRIVYATPNTSQDEYENPRDVIDLQLSYKFLKNRRAEVRLNISDLLNQELFLYRNQFGPGNSEYTERTPSVPWYPGEGYILPEGQKDPKGTAYNAYYDVKTISRKMGTTYTLNFSYRF